MSRIVKSFRIISPHYKKNHVGLEVYGSSRARYSSAACPLHLPRRGRGALFSTGLCSHEERRGAKITQQKRCMSSEGLLQAQQNLYTSISESTLVGLFKEGLLSLHEMTGLPWWATIVAATVLARTTITLPVAVYQQGIIARFENVKLELDDLSKDVMQATKYAEHKFNLTQEQASVLFSSSMRKNYRELIIRDNCHPFRATILMWVQIPLWFSMSFALRNLVYLRPGADSNAQSIFTELSVGGIGWIQDLTACDSTWILPITMGVVNLMIIELSTMSRLSPPTRVQKVIFNVMRLLTLSLVPISANVPACMCLYWTTSCVYGLAQNIALLSPELRRKCGIPETPSELEEPYTHIAAEVKERGARMNPFKSKAA